MQKKKYIYIYIILFLPPHSKNMRKSPVLLSAHVKRFSVSRMGDFFSLNKSTNRSWIYFGWKKSRVTFLGQILAICEAKQGMLSVECGVCLPLLVLVPTLRPSQIRAVVHSQIQAIIQYEISLTVHSQIEAKIHSKIEATINSQIYSQVQVNFNFQMEEIVYSQIE